ncbi:hypothetical protein C9374_008625 [Naegleria lovaniensis]|uniref:Uncharacterized protein n=1 Tax=Naegleria lovaniensis TaxID=51637 RepID=A0AA88GGA4_NAELO|nr:uncharacterized protein C9374_008625 [Naegleria lovaniensis]KAG2378003.1 hypothetical protein C9374_008625 [Naegleria lovaniensis]
MTSFLTTERSSLKGLGGNLMSLSASPIIGGPQLERDQKHFPFSRSTADMKEVERTHKDLVVPSNRTDDPFREIQSTPDVLSWKTKINELEVQIDYLKDVVQRLSDELARYQVKYPPIAAEHSESIIIAPWFFDSQHMNPLLVSYDHRIMELSNEIKLYKEKIESLNAEVKSVSTENEELQQNLKNLIEKQISKNNEQNSVIPFNIPSEEWDELQQRVELLDRENKLLLEEQRELQNEIDRLRNENRRSFSESNPFVPGDSDRVKLMLESAKKKIASLQKEKEDLKRDTRRVKQLEHEMADLERALSASNQRCKLLDDELEKHKCIIDDLQHERKRLYQTEKTINIKDIEMNEIRERYSISLREIDDLKEEKSKVLLELGQMEQRIVAHQQSEFEALQKVKETMELLETTKLERDSVKTAAKNKEQEIERLEEKMKKLTQDYTDRYKRMSSHFQEKHNESLQALEDQLKQVQFENGHLKSDLDRLKREKKTCEDELAKVIKAAETEQLNSPFVINDLNHQITQLTNERDESERQYERLRNSQKRTQQQWEQEREQLNAKYNEMQKRFISMESEAEEQRQINLRLNEHISRLEQQCQNVKFEKEEIERSLRDTLRSHQELSSNDTRDMKKKLQIALDEYNKSQNTIQQLTLKHQKEHLYWKEEFSKMKEKKEKELYDMTSIVEQLTRRNQEMEGKIKLLLKKEEELLNHKKDLHIRADKLTIYLERMKRERDMLAKQIGAAEISFGYE